MVVNLVARVLMMITVRRVQRVRDWGGLYQIWIDGERVAWIFSGMTKTLEVDPGEHEMVCMMNKTLTSPKLKFVVGETPVTFEVEAGAGRFSAAGERMRVSHNYIQLRQVT